VLAATDRELRLWNVADGVLVARVATQTEFVLPPEFSADGAYVAIAERVDAANPLYSVLRSADATLVASIEGVPDASQWELGPGARWLALLGPANVLRVLETRRGTELARLPHRVPIGRVLPAADGAAIVTVDVDGAIVAWPLVAGRATVPRELGVTASSTSVSASADANRIAFTRADGAVVVVDVATGATLYRFRHLLADPITTTQLSTDGTELVTQAGVVLRSWTLPATSPVTVARSDAVPTAVAFDPATRLVAIGLRSGELQFASADTLATPRASLAFFGHRGPITAVALDASRGLAATGGSDGIVRLWDVAAASPTGAVMQPTNTAISSVALSADGRFVANAAGRTVRVANVADGTVIAEITLRDAANALAFAPEGTSIAVGDESGVVTIAPFAPARARVVASFDRPVSALAFSADGTRLAVGDVAGLVRLVAPADGAISAVGAQWPQPVRWLGFSPEGGVLFAATDAWLHALAAFQSASALEPLHSKLVQLPDAPRVAVAMSPSVVRIIGLDATASLGVGDFDVAAPIAVSGSVAPLVVRDWPAVLALRLDDNGDAVPFDP
jgi:WD40 repeat protein